MGRKLLQKQPIKSMNRITRLHRMENYGAAFVESEQVERNRSPCMGNYNDIAVPVAAPHEQH